MVLHNSYWVLSWSKAFISFSFQSFIDISFVIGYALNRIYEEKPFVCEEIAKSHRNCIESCQVEELFHSCPYVSLALGIFLFIEEYLLKNWSIFFVHRRINLRLNPCIFALLPNLEKSLYWWVYRYWLIIFWNCSGLWQESFRSAP